MLFRQVNRRARERVRISRHQQSQTTYWCPAPRNWWGGGERATRLERAVQGLVHAGYPSRAAGGERDGMREMGSTLLSGRRKKSVKSNRYAFEA